MDTLTVDVRGLPNEKVRELEQLIERWKQQRAAGVTMQKRKGEEIVFATHDSNVIGGEFKRANAYE